MNPKCVPCWWFQPLKNISQNGNLPQIWVKEYWNHHPGSVALARIMPWSVFQWAEDPFFFSGRAMRKTAVLGRMSGKQFETSSENDIFKETCLSSASLLQNPQQCLKLHDIYIYSSPVAKKKTSIFWTLQFLHLTSSYNPFPRWFQPPCHASHFFFILPIPLSLPNDGTAFPAAFAKSRVPGKMALVHGGGSLEGGTPRVPTPHQVCCVFF